MGARPPRKPNDREITGPSTGAPEMLAPVPAGVGIPEYRGSSPTAETARSKQIRPALFPAPAFRGGAGTSPPFKVKRGDIGRPPPQAPPPYVVAFTPRPAVAATPPPPGLFGPPPRPNILPALPSPTDVAVNPFFSSSRARAPGSA